MSRTFKAVVFRDEAGDYRWRLMAANGQIVAVAGEGYEHREHAADMVRELFPEAHIEPVE